MGASVMRAALALVLAATLFAVGWVQGRTGERAAWTARMAIVQAERARAAARIAGLTEALQHAQEARAALAAQLEDEAHADDDAGRMALPARSLQRLDRR